MTLTEMKAYFELLLAETSTSSDFLTSAQETDLINEGCEIFAMETKIIRPTYQSVTLATDDPTYDLESTFLAVTEGVFLYNAANTTFQWEITTMDKGYREIMTNNSTSGSPMKYAIRGYTKATAAASPVLNIHFDPPPSSTYNTYIARVYYAAQSLALSGATDVSNIPVQFHRGAVCLAVALFKERDQEMEQAAYFRQRAKYWIEKATTEQFRWDRSVSKFRFAKGQYVKR